MTWDELLYMNLSLHPEANPYILNRYIHIYLQKLFFLLFGSPVPGAVGFWSFLVALTLSLIVVNSSILSGTRWKPFLAALFFLSQSSLFDFAGATYADVTLMCVVMLGMTVYIFYACNITHSRSATLFLFGLTSVRLSKSY